MRICIDIDGTICPTRQPSQTYQNILPFEGAARTIQSLRQEGAYIIFCTARHMETCNSNIGQVVARQGQVLLEWLKEHGFEYDELWFGKPYAHIYIDDRAFKFKGSWEDVNGALLKEYI